MRNKSNPRSGPQCLTPGVPSPKIDGSLFSDSYGLLRRWQERKKKASFLSPVRRFPPLLTVSETFAFAARLLLPKSSAIPDAVASLLALTSASLMSPPPASPTLERRRVSISLSLFRDPAVLLDEPTGLDNMGEEVAEHRLGLRNGYWREAGRAAAGVGVRSGAVPAKRRHAAVELAVDPLFFYVVLLGERLLAAAAAEGGDERSEVQLLAWIPRLALGNRNDHELFLSLPICLGRDGALTVANSTSQKRSLTPSNPSFLIFRKVSHSWEEARHGLTKPFLLTPPPPFLNPFEYRS